MANICPTNTGVNRPMISLIEKIEGQHMNDYYTAAQAIRKLNIPRSTFYYLIKSGEIPEGVIAPLRKQAVYSKKAIDNLAEDRAKSLNDLEETPERLAFLLSNQDDLVQLTDVDRMAFHEETFIVPEQQKKKTRAVKRIVLRSGGVLTFSSHIDIFSLSEEDRRFVLDILERIRAYEERDSDV